MLEHEREIAAINAQKKKLHPAVIAGAVFLVLGALTGAYFGLYQPAMARQEAKAAAEKAKAERAAQEAEEARQAAALEAQKRAEAEAEKARLAEAAERERRAAAEARQRNASKGQSKSRRRRSGSSKPRQQNGDDPLAGLDSL
jgi:uncharacterized iron-regulated membrane protein